MQKSKKQLFILIGLVILLIIIVLLFVQHFFIPTQPTPIKQADVVVTRTIAATPNYIFQINVPSEFFNTTTFDKSVFLNGGVTVKGNVTFLNGVQSSGPVTAPNLLYSITAGNGIGITTGQTPTITNTGVTSIQGATGAVSLIAGNNVSINGLTISANIPSQTTQDVFKNFTIDGGGTLTPTSDSDSLTFIPGSGIVLTANTTDNSITIEALGVNLNNGISGILPIANGGTNTSSLGLAGAVAYSNGSSYAFTDVGTTGYLLQSTGNGTPVWVSPSLIPINVGGTVTVNKLDVNEMDPLASSIGEATLPVGKTTLIIQSSAMTKNSKLFLTPELPLDFSLGVTSRVA